MSTTNLSIQSDCRHPFSAFLHRLRAWAVGNSRKIRDLLRHLYFRLQQNPVLKNLLVFLRAAAPNALDLNANESMRTSAFNGPLQAACREVELRRQVSTYDWQWEFLTTIANNASNDVARQYAGHKYNRAQDTTLRRLLSLWTR